MSDRDIQEILVDVDTFIEECDKVLERSFIEFPGYRELYEDPQGTLKSIQEHQSFLSDIGSQHTRVSQFRLRMQKLVRHVESMVAPTDYQKAKVLIREMNTRLSTLVDLEKVFWTRKSYLEHAITSLRSIQSTYTERGQFLKYGLGG